MNIDDFENMIAREAEIIDQIIQSEVEAWHAPELERFMVEQYLGMSDEERAIMPKEYRDKVRLVIDRMESRYGR